MCDTLVATSSFTGKPTVLFAKNSDREPNEAQHLVRIPRHDKTINKTQTTYIEVDHAKEINEVILSKPFQMWGAEMGVNEHGVVIGNEAVFTRFKFKKDNTGLTGMDMLRLALECTDSAEAARDKIIYYIERYGQDACGGYQDKNFYYHNSFIIADYRNAFLVESACRYWAWRKINSFQSISNCLSIREDFDEISIGAKEHARKKKVDKVKRSI